jgi:hypothetical protein
MRKSCLFLSFLILAVFSATNSMAITYELSGDSRLYLTGKIEQYMRYGFNNCGDTLPGGAKASGAYRGLSEAFYSVLLEQHYKPNEIFEFRSGFRLEGDWAYNINDSDSDWKKDIAHSEGLMKRDSHNAQRDVLREFNIGINTRYVNARIGKQTVVWGETDLYRLMDMFNPLDYGRFYVIRDADYGYEETRIPLWALRVGITPELSIGPLSDIQFEFAMTPEVRQAKMNVGPREGGVWAFPIPSNMPDLGGAAAVLMGVPIGALGPVNIKNLDVRPGDDHGMRAQTLENATYDFRVKTSWGNANITLNAFYAWDELPIFQKAADMKNTVLIPAGAMGNPGALPSLGYLSLENGGNVDDGFGYGLTLQRKLYRKQGLGFTLAKEMDFTQSLVKAIGQPANPTLRIEAIYQFRKHISTDWVENLKRGAARINAGDMGGVPVLLKGLADGVDGYEKKDVLHYTLGMDWPLRIAFLNPRKQFFTSYQIVHQHIFGDVGDRFYVAPYSERIPRDKLEGTFLVYTEYFNEKIKPQYVFSWDLNNTNNHMHKFSCRFWLGDHWRPEIGFWLVTGNTDQSHAKFVDGDCAWARLTYQF